MLIVDAHCDTLTVLTPQGRDLGTLSQRGHIDIPRLYRGGINVQFFAIFIGPDNYHDPAQYTKEILKLFNKEIQRNASSLLHARNYADIVHAYDSKKICAVLTIEGGEALKGKIEQLESYYTQGIRGLTLTWNGRNELGDGVGLGPEASGLTVFGRQVIQKMVELGMMIDVSHLSEAGFWDVISEIRAPITASHANSRFICDHPRNLTDQQIRVISESGGVIGVTYVPQFIDLSKPSIERLIEHIDHIYEVGGISCIGLGSDFDGIDATVEGLHDASIAVPNLENALIKKGYTTGEIEKIMGENWLRVFKEVCG
ncbi:dipeptidase, Metallo peptidase, MEROPS family M19 [Desulforamulus reducens MI-1]|uniref:Dipeptidase, Metallo peptidase, MEROPS family M19 n=2 Tax=Desulforamulus TaxID=2916693 RepID=A4J5T3_DESRM|nr:dipeptidase, Metallo peptidase, MEROPS family M19 [Desulforamulus reducens MI-1]